MNIQIKETPLITIENCKTLKEQKVAIDFAYRFTIDLPKLRMMTRTKPYINDCAYEHIGVYYHAWLTKTGNIKVKKLD
jgi:hypothetical protein